MANLRYPLRTVTALYSRQTSWANWDDSCSDLSSVSRLTDQHFGMGPTMIDEFFNQWRNWMHTHAFSVSLPHSNPNINYQQAIGFSGVTHDDKEFRVRLDVNHFSPEEITVKTVENRVLIHAKHEEKQDEHGFIQREFTRQYLLPRECDTNNVISALSSDGILTIRAPKTLPANGNERVIPITQEIAKT